MQIAPLYFLQGCFGFQTEFGVDYCVVMVKTLLLWYNYKKKLIAVRQKQYEYYRDNLLTFKEKECNAL